jgi:hypothetical protein
MTITEFLIAKFGFKKLFQKRETDESIDWDKFTCSLRIHEIHYLFWSEDLKHFSLSVKHEKPKGMAGGGYRYWTHVTVPKPIYTTEEAEAVVMGIVNFDYMKGICQ